MVELARLLLAEAATCVEKAFLPSTSMGAKAILPPSPEARSVLPSASVKFSFPVAGSTVAVTADVATFTRPPSIVTENGVFSFTGSTTRLFRSLNFLSGVAETRMIFSPSTWSRTWAAPPSAGAWSFTVTVLPFTA